MKLLFYIVKLKAYSYSSSRNYRLKDKDIINFIVRYNYQRIIDRRIDQIGCKEGEKQEKSIS